MEHTKIDLEGEPIEPIIGHMWDIDDKLRLEAYRQTSDDDFAREMEPLFGFWEYHLRYAQLVYSYKMRVHPDRYPATGPLQGGMVVVGVAGIGEIFGGIVGAAWGLSTFFVEGLVVAVEGSIWSIDQKIAGEDIDLVGNFFAPIGIIIGVKGTNLTFSKIANGRRVDGSLDSEIVEKIDDVVQTIKEQNIVPQAIEPPKSSDIELIKNTIASSVERQSGRPAEKQFLGLLESQFERGRFNEIHGERVFHDGVEVRQKVKGSTAPDFTIVGLDDVALYVEFKSYKRLWSNDPKVRKAGIRQLVSIVSKQVRARDLNIGDANSLTEQVVIIDMRQAVRNYGLSQTRDVVQEIARLLGEKTNHRIKPSDIAPITF